MTAADRGAALRDSSAWLIATACILVSMAVPVVHGDVAARIGVPHAFQAGTIVMLVCAIVAIRWWPRPYDISSARVMPVFHAAGALAAFACCLWTASRLVPAIFAGPLDVNRGDMLVLVESGAKELIAGHMPYHMYHLPWDAPLSYGPTLWLPYAIPVLGRFDVRVVSLVADLSVIAICVIASALVVARRRIVPAVSIAALAVAFAAQPQIASFYPTAHTPVYWPLLVVFCLTLSTDRWVMAAVTLGLLVSARTTMVSLVPIFLMAAYFRRRLDVPLVVALVVTSVGPFLPFLIKDFRAVLYGMVGVYPHTIKGFIWRQTTFALTTYGVTAQLLAHGFDRYVEAVQIGCMLAVYAVAWRPLARGARPEPWMALALLVFTMTTLWPVLYTYFDVWVLFIAGILGASSGPWLAANRRGAAIAAASAIVVALVAVFAAGAMRPGSSYPIDIGAPAAAGFTGGGFGQDDPSFEDGRQFVWVTDGAARIRLPRAAWTSANVSIDLRPFEPSAGLHQTVAASLNGRPLGLVNLGPGWQRISFHAPRRDWTYGFNVLDLYFGYALPDASGRRVSAGIDRVEIN
jgi:hypothetical protein